MIVIRTAKDLARALDSPLPPAVKRRLQHHQHRLAEYDGFELSELANFLITQPADTLEDLNAASPAGPIAGTAGFHLEPECIERLPGWYELTFILSDDGFGLVVFIEQGSILDRQFANAIDSWIADRADSIKP